VLIRKLKDCQEIIAGDGSRLKELLHPERGYDFNGNYSLAYAVLAPGAKSLKHKLATDEVYFILSGRGEMHINEETAQVSFGDVIDIPPNAVQWIKNIGDFDLSFLCLVSPPWKAEDEEILA